MEAQAIEKAYRNPIPNFGFQTLVAITNNVRLKSVLTLEDVCKDLERNGALIANGFTDGADDFNQLVELYSGKVTKDPARSSSSKNTAEIKAGVCEMGLHMENGNLPYSPDIQWFYCISPASKGSETTLCDGEQVYKKMKPSIRRLFDENNIKYDRLIPWENVKNYLSIELGKSPEEIGQSDLDYVNETHYGQRYTVFDRNLIRSELVTSAVVKSSFSGRAAFCNSLLGPSVNYEPPQITWEDGSVIDIHILDEIRALTEDLTYDHFWAQGDIVIIDNTRVMHGRRYLEDSGRRILGAQSYLKGE